MQRLAAASGLRATGLLDVIRRQALTPLDDWPPIYLVGLCATIGHNAYHLGAIRQIARVVRAVR